MSRRVTRAAAFDGFSSTPCQPIAGNLINSNTAMYMNNQYNHPAFNKLYLGPNLSLSGKSHGAASAVPKPPKPPEKPLMPYMRYSRKVWDEVKANQPELKLWEIGKIIGKMWRELPSGDKQLYMEEYDAEKVEYQDLLKSYHNSPAYQGYLQAKGRAEAAEAAESRSAERDDSCMSIEPADDGIGDTDEGFSVKHVAAARFQRNHRLMQEILAESSMVPSGKGIVTKQRLDVLRKQVQSLERHQSKLKNELLEIEKNHSLTKRKWKDSASSFALEVKRLRNMTPQEYYLEYKKKQQALKNQAQKEAAEQAAAAAAAEAASNSEVKPDQTPDDKTDESANDASKDSTSSTMDISNINNTETQKDDPEDVQDKDEKVENQSNADAEVEALPAAANDVEMLLDKSTTEEDASNVEAQTEDPTESPKPDTGSEENVDSNKPVDDENTEDTDTTVSSPIAENTNESDKPTTDDEEKN